MTVKTTEPTNEVPLDDIAEAVPILVQDHLIDALTDHAIDQYRDGRSRPLRDLARSANVDLDEPDHVDGE